MAVSDPVFYASPCIFGMIYESTTHLADTTRLQLADRPNIIATFVLRTGTDRHWQDWYTR